MISPRKLKQKPGGGAAKCNIRRRIGKVVVVKNDYDNSNGIIGIVHCAPITDNLYVLQYMDRVKM